MKVKPLQLGTLLVLVAAFVFVGVRHQAIQDWIKLRGYKPPAAVVQLATDDTMTNEAKHLFYVNKPDITAGSAFTSHCPIGGEKTVVLGCYIGTDDGIYLYNVTDSRLDGVEQVTAAHETLHAAYRRLSSAERTKIDGWLTDYYKNQLTDQRIKDTIDAYKKSEPNDVVNEMHSIFGTEVAHLPAPLEQYYKQYFTNRSKITGYTATYQNEFTSRQNQVKAYDAQLKTIKGQIDTNESLLTQQKSAIDDKASRLQQLRTSDVAAYNAAVPGYNSAVDTYNNLLRTTRTLITQYNGIVSARNDVAVQEQQLVQALSANSLPDSQ